LQKTAAVYTRFAPKFGDLALGLHKNDDLIRRPISSYNYFPRNQRSRRRVMVLTWPWYMNVTDRLVDRQTDSLLRVQ